MKKISLLLFSVFAISNSTSAQSGFESFALASNADSKKLFQSYFSPGMEGFINSMNNGWYHTAKVHKKFGFDISFGLNGSIAPSEKELFDISTLGLTSVTATNSGETILPTFAGSAPGRNLTVNTTVDGQDVTAKFESPEGVAKNFPLNIIPAPAIQLTVGLPFKLDLMARYVPEMSIGENEGSIDMFGIGLKKEITSWFGPIEKLPLHVSLLAAYTNMDVSYSTDLNSANLEIENGFTEFELSAFTVQAIASLNFPIINIYGGFGYNSGNANLNNSGTYTGKFTTSNGETVRTNLNIPTDFAFDSSGFRSTIGARLSLGFFKIFGAYTLQEFDTLTLGAAISIR